MKISNAPLQDVLIITPQIFTDERGFFFESYHALRYALPSFVQDNSSRSTRGVMRGLHYQNPQAQGKLVWVTRGAVWDVVVDIRRSSKTFGQWYGQLLSDENHLQLYVPAGFAHGFCVLSDVADFHYKCTDYFSPQSERGIIWNDPDIDIKWPLSTPILSVKDQQYPRLNEIADEQLFP